MENPVLTNVATEVSAMLGATNPRPEMGHGSIGTIAVPVPESPDMEKDAWMPAPVGKMNHFSLVRPN